MLNVVTGKHREMYANRSSNGDVRQGASGEKIRCAFMLYQLPNKLTIFKIILNKVNKIEIVAVTG